ncbi:MAG: hypothetical protein JW863_07820 [Chitinispirillaceae bacterium]|nr:hypothetical protein [Chitinispirillaceae bacterium]
MRHILTLPPLRIEVVEPTSYPSRVNSDTCALPCQPERNSVSPETVADRVTVPLCCLQR